MWHEFGPTFPEISTMTLVVMEARMFYFTLFIYPTNDIQIKTTNDYSYIILVLLQAITRFGWSSDRCYAAYISSF